MLNWIVAEKNSSSDEELEVLNNLCENGATVQKNDSLYEVEGAKSIFEIYAPISGYIYNLFFRGDKVNIGDPIGVISDEVLNEIPKWKANFKTVDNELILASQNVTKKAIEYAKKNNYDLSLVPKVEILTVESIKLFFEGASKIESPPAKFKKCVLVGGGNGAIQLRESLMNNSNLNIVGVFDDKNNSLEELGIPLLGQIDKDIFQKSVENNTIQAAFIAVTSNMKLRVQWHDILVKLNLLNEVAIHKNSNMARSAEIESGSVIMDNTRLGAFSSIGQNVFLSAFVDVEHHVKIGRNSTFGPGVFISGGVEIGDNCIFGSGVVVEPGLVIGDNCQIASGSIITRNIPSGSLVKLRNTTIIN
jgi:acetyltransferase-like isoleucine patch superfamily enzyme